MGSDMPLIVVLPGIGGSVLSRSDRPDDVVWDAGKGDITDLLVHPDRISLSASPSLAPVGLTSSTKLLGFTLVPGYERLLQQLEVFGVVDRRGDPSRPVPGAAVVAVPYDFRQSIALAAERLDDVVRAHLGETSEEERARRVLVVAHSLGGLVARYWLGPLGRWRWCGQLITLGTPHRGAPKALDWLVNGVRVGGQQLSRPTGLLREWPSIRELLPRYQVVRSTVRGKAVSCYPHELPLVELAGARAAYDLHAAIDQAWSEMPRSGTKVVPCVGWSHPTPSAAFWNGRVLSVTKEHPGWLNLPELEQDFGDGTVPALSAVPVEMSTEVTAPVRLLDRHVPMAAVPRVSELLVTFLQGRRLEAVHGAEPARTAAIGLDLEELYGEGEPIPLSVALRQVPPGRDSQPVWVTLRRQRARPGATLDVRLVWDAVAQRFVGELPGQAVGLYEVTVLAREVPQVGDLAVTGTLAVVADD